MDLIGTWKNKVDFDASIALATDLRSWVEERELRTKVQILPQAVALAAVSSILTPRFETGCQNVGWNASHALTGETRAESAKEAGASFVMIGHSERRTYLGESNEQIANKLRAALQAGLGALVCVGETYSERIDGSTERVLTEQIDALRPVFDEFSLGGSRIAYEPAWAITTSEQSLPADPSLATKDHDFLRSLLIDKFDHLGETVPLIYGAGVNLGNVVEFAEIDNVDGVLVGGASQSLESLTTLIERMETVE